MPTQILVNKLTEAYKVFDIMRSYMESTVFGRNEGDDGEYTILYPDPEKRPLGTINLILAALFSRGHLLLEDYPGTGKTYMVKMLQKMIKNDIASLGEENEDYRRIQCVPDLMPGDITGFDVLVEGQMIFRKGPIFCSVLLLDEINRTTPKVQSALLEAMAESQVTVGDRTYDLGKLFFVVATQNPHDLVGTFPLPAAQLDRFLFKRKLIPVSDNMVEEIIFYKELKEPPDVLITQLIAAIEAVNEVDENRKVMGPYLRQLGLEIDKLIESDKNQSLELKEGSKPSPRSLQGLLRALKVVALIQSGGKNLTDLKVTPQLVQRIACDYFRHRIYPVDEDMKDKKRDELILKVIDRVNTKMYVDYRE
jgi:MoxR-like ATPase